MSLKGEVGCLFGSLILLATPLSGQEETGGRSEGRRSGSAAGFPIRLQVQLVRAGGAQDDQTFQMIQHLWPLAVFMCPPNLPSLPLPSLPPSLSHPTPTSLICLKHLE